MGPDSSELIRKLNKTCLLALQAGSGLCLTRTNPNVEIEHWLTKLIEVRDTDLSRIFTHFEIDPASVQADLTRSLDGLKRGFSRTPPLSPMIDSLIREAWLFASIQFGDTKIRSGALLLALLTGEALRGMAAEASIALTRIPAETLRQGLAEMTRGSAEDGSTSAGARGLRDGRRGAAGDPGGRTDAATPALDQFTIDLTRRARDGEIDPVVGRDGEVRQMVDILIRRRQNNPILTGEAGVGKTAVVEGFAMRVASGDVPPALRDVVVRTLDLGLLQAGAGIKGEFENRLKGVIAEVKASPVPVILFIDEAHTLIGAGGAEGQGDAANLLKPALARGELRTIAATTWAEYKRYFEKDAALARRFQVVKVEEPSENRAMLMMRGVTATLEAHHGVRILDEAVEASVKLSARYLSGRQLPDKSVSLLDTACARVAIGQGTEPPQVEAARREIDHLGVEIAILRREGATGAKHGERLAEATAALDAARRRLADLETRWERERAHVDEIRSLRDRIEALHSVRQDDPDAPGPSEEESRLLADLDAATAALRQAQGADPLMQVAVDAQAIAGVIAGWTGIPVGKMMADEIRTVLDLPARLAERVIGQSSALEAIGRRVRTSRANLTDPRKPVGVFLLVGPSGVGKTETALALSDALYGGERNLITLNMSEYQEAHTVSALKGSPPGYVGYGQGGVLTEAVRKRPYATVLLDEVEKAHPDVLELFFQVFDKGVLEDGEGREIDFKNTVILLTSNVGSDTLVKLCADPDTAPESAELAAALRPDLLKAFPAALLGRMITVPYYPIGDETMRKIVRLQLDRIVQRIQVNHRVRFEYGDDLVDSIAARCREVETGARNVDHILTDSLLPELSATFLSRMAEGKPIGAVRVSMIEGGSFDYEIGGADRTSDR